MSKGQLTEIKRRGGLILKGMTRKKGKSSLLTANARDLDKDSGDSDSLLYTIKSMHNFEERLCKLWQLYIRKIYRHKKTNCLKLERKYNTMIILTLLLLDPRESVTPISYLSKVYIHKNKIERFLHFT